MTKRGKPCKWPTDFIQYLHFLENRGELYRMLVTPGEGVMEARIVPPVSSLSKIASMDKAEMVFRWKREWDTFVNDNYFVEMDVGNGYIGTVKNQVIPQMVRITGVSAMFRLIKMLHKMVAFQKNYETAVSCNPLLSSWAMKDYALLSEDCNKMPALMELARHMEKTITDTAPWIYKRELSIPGVDTKFLERNVEHIRLMYNALHGTALKNKTELWSALHIQNAPEDREFVPLRLTLPNPYGVKNIRVLRSELTDLTIHPQRVFIVENKETFYHFPELKDSIVIWGQGLSVSGFLQDVSFLEKAEHIYYWSDLDTDGFTMLSRLRGVYPKVKSLLMDKETIEAAKCFIGKDEGSEVGHVENLTAEEHSCFNYLTERRYRIEQEQIPWDYVLKKVRSLVK